MSLGHCSPPLKFRGIFLRALPKDSVEPIPTELVKALISQELLEGEPLETLFRYCVRRSLNLPSALQSPEYLLCVLCSHGEGAKKRY